MVFDVSFDWITAGTGADEVLGGKKKPAVCLVSLYGNCGGGSPHLIDFNLRKCCVWQTERLTHVTLRRTASTNYLQLTQTILSPGNNCQETSNLIQPYQYHLFWTIRFVAKGERRRVDFMSMTQSWKWQISSKVEQLYIRHLERDEISRWMSRSSKSTSLLSQRDLRGEMYWSCVTDIL